MSDPTATRTALLLGSGRRFSAEVARRLERDGYRLLSAVAVSPSGVQAALVDGATLDAVVVNTAGHVSGASFLSLPDEAMVACLDGFLDLVEALQVALPRLREGGALVALTSRGYLGGWGGADEMAFSGAVVALMRSISLENTPRGVRANVVASDFAPEDFGGDRRAPPDHGARVAGAVAFFVSEDSAAVSGELLLTNSGRSLQRREGRDRREELDA